MKASVGDRIVVASNRLDGPVRDGKVVAVQGADGAPPYTVVWSDTGKTAVVFPGPDAVVEHLGDGPEPVHAASPRHVRSWHVRVDIFESDDETTAHAVLVGDAPVPVEARGHAGTAPGATDVPETRAEEAVGRALGQLADVLLGVGSAAPSR